MAGGVNMAKMLVAAFLISSLFLPFSSSAPPVPTADILAWTKLEVGMMYSYGMIAFNSATTRNTQYFCLGVGGSGGSLPPPSQFNPSQIDLDNWLDAAVAIGAKYAVLVAQHCSGFSMWPTDIKNETGFDYTFSIKNSPLKSGGYDIVKEFIDSCKRHDVLPGIYYSLNQNYYLNAGGGHVKETPLVPGQAKVSQDLYGRIVLAQMRELWTNYGQLAEIWFDGGCSVPGTSDNISSLLQTLQPHAVYFGGCATQNNLRWIGTESGRPGYPIWSTSQDCREGTGDPDGNVFCPAESDTTLHSTGQWFWREGDAIKTLSDLQTTYYKTVGQNTNLLLNAAPNDKGLIEEESMSRYKEFGAWIQSCFSHPVIATSGKGQILKLISAAGQPFMFNKVVLQEDQSGGEAVKKFSLYNPFYNGSTAIYTGQSIGHKLIINLADDPWPSHELVLNVTDTAMNPVIANFAAYHCPP